MLRQGLISGVALVAILAPSAGAFEASGERWPSTTLTWSAEQPVQRAAASAAAAWNRSGAGIRFVRAADGATPDVRVSVSGEGCRGVAQVGYVPGGEAAPVKLGATCPHRLQRRLAAHELGHILGLAHEDESCAAMNASAGARCGDKPALVAADDVAGVRALYAAPRLPALPALPKL